MADNNYTGPVVCVGEPPIHYAVGKDGHADLTRPLRWEDGSYRDAVDGEPTHNEVYASAGIDLEPGSEN